MTPFTAEQLAECVSGRVEGDASREISDVASVKDAGPEDLTFVADRRSRRALRDARPGIVLAPPDLQTGETDAVLIRVEKPQLAFARLLRMIHPEPPVEAGVHPTAVVGPGATLGEGVSVGPYTVVGPEVDVGAETRIGAHSVLEQGAVVGEGCVIGNSCSILGGVRMGTRVQVQDGVRLGTEGYGYAEEDRGPVKIPQVGGCIIENDVEIGANTTVDRGALGDTVIGAGTKIDNMVHIGHNVRIGRNCLIVAQVGIAGSVTVGPGVQLGGQAGVAGHLTIGEGARIAAKAGVIGDVPAGATYSGYPARPHAEAMRASAALFRLPELLSRVKRLEEDRVDGSPASDAGTASPEGGNWEEQGG